MHNINALSEKNKKQKQLPLHHFLTFTSNLTPMFNFLSNLITKETICLLSWYTFSSSC